MDDVVRLVESACVRLISESKIEVKGVDSRLKTLDPLATINRGFSIVRLPLSGKIVSSTSHVREGDSVEITVANGSIPAVVGRPAIIKPKSKESTSDRKVSESRTNIKAKPPRMTPLL